MKSSHSSAIMILVIAIALLKNRFKLVCKYVIHHCTATSSISVVNSIYIAFKMRVNYITSTAAAFAVSTEEVSDSITTSPTLR